MKRDPELIRKILTKIEGNPACTIISDLQIQGFSPEEVMEHVELLLDANFIKGRINVDVSGKPQQHLIERMTWDGQEFLAIAKNDTAWNSVLSSAKEKGLALSVSVLSALLIEASKRAFGLSHP
jgi:hypothetical protein